MSKKENISFFSVIYNHLLKLIELAYSRERMDIHAEAVWAALRPYINEDLERLWKSKSRKGVYKGMLWKVRVIMLTLYEIEALPKSNIDQEDRVFGEHEPNYEGDRVTIANELNFEDLMMRYFYLLTDLTFEGTDLESMHFMADLGYFLCSPYITWEDLEEWKEQTDIGEFDRRRWFTGKVSIISSVLDREGMQFERRAIDQVSVPNEPVEEKINPYEEDNYQDLDLRVVDEE